MRNAGLIGGILAFATLVWIISEVKPKPPVARPAQARPGTGGTAQSPLEDPEAQGPRKSIEELTREAAQMNLPVPPPFTADVTQIDGYMASLDQIIKTGNPTSRKAALNARRDYLREKSHQHALEEKKASKQRHADRRAEQEAHRAEHPLKPMPPHDPDKKPPPPVEFESDGPAVTGVIEPPKETPPPPPKPSPPVKQ